MNKIPTLFVRDLDSEVRIGPVTEKVNPACQWVIDGEGIATRKYDGTCVMLDVDGRWWARRTVKQFGVAPLNYVEVEHDPVTGKTQGWEPIEQSSFAKFHADALIGGHGLPGTYELCGPKINGNPECLDDHVLIEHRLAERHYVPIEYDKIKWWLADHPSLEGIVWHHPDRRMAKIKRRDFVL